MRAHLMSIGTELALGQTVDTNSAWLARELAGLGLLSELHLCVTDDQPAITAALRESAQRCDLLIVTGGLGPTADDLTRFALAEAMGATLERRPQAEAHLEAFFAARGRAMKEANRVQADFPVGSLMIPNPVGTAPGIAARLGRCAAFFLPGVPREMKHLFEHTLRPTLSLSVPATADSAPFRALLPEAVLQAGGQRCIRSTVIQTYGQGESEIGERISDLMARDRNPNVGTTAKDGVIGVRINADGLTPAEAQALLDADRAEVRRRLGNIVFGEGEHATLEAAVVSELASRGLTVALAESCTGGRVAAALTDVPGSSAVLVEGVVCYSNISKARRLGVPEALLAAHGAVSEPVARALAEGALAQSNAHLALSVTGIAGPDGGSDEKPVGTVHFALARQGRPTRHSVQRFGGDREQVRQRATRFALGWLRDEAREA